MSNHADIKCLLFWSRDVSIEKGALATGEAVEINIAARAFVRLLLRLRLVFLQDAVAWKEQNPHFDLWSHPLSQSPEVLDAPDTTTEDILRSLAPLVAEQMQSYASATQLHFDQRTRAIQTDVQTTMSSLMEMLATQRR